MARHNKSNQKKKRNQRDSSNEKLVQVDIYYIPEEQAELYSVLREVVAEEVTEWAETQFNHAERVLDADKGESVVAYNQIQQPVWRYYLSPNNISDAQKARDKEQLATYLEKYQNPIED